MFGANKIIQVHACGIWAFFYNDSYSVTEWSGRYVTMVSVSSVTLRDVSGLQSGESQKLKEYWVADVSRGRPLLLLLLSRPVTCNKTCNRLCAIQHLRCTRKTNLTCVLHLISFQEAAHTMLRQRPNEEQ
jgi:hypothetical protein